MFFYSAQIHPIPANLINWIRDKSYLKRYTCRHGVLLYSERWTRKYAILATNITFSKQFLSSIGYKVTANVVMKLFIHPQTVTAELLKFGNG